MSETLPTDRTLGHRVAHTIATVAASSATQVAFLLLYLVWFTRGWDLNWLMTILAIVSLTLTQMVLKRQLAIESENRRRDIALHAKLDELIVSQGGARDEMAGIEELDEEVIEQMRAQNETPSGAAPPERAPRPPLP